MTTIRVSPTEVNPTHHIKLTDSAGTSLGIIVGDADGEPNELRMTRQPVQTTAMKISTGNPTYGDMVPPYYAVAQQDWTGGLGSDEFEKNTTMFADSLRAWTSHPGKVHAAVMERYYSMSGTNSFISGWPPTGAISWKALTNRVAIKLAITDDITMYRAVVLVRRVSAGNASSALTGHHATGTTPGGDLQNPLKGSITGDMARYEARMLTLHVIDGSTVPTLSTLNTNWLVLDANADYEIATFSFGSAAEVYEYTSGAWATISKYTPVMVMSEVYKHAKLFDYLGMTYLAFDDDYILRLGDRGVADDNTGSLNKLIDASKSWATNRWAGATVVLISDTLREDQRWRKIISNDSTSLTVDKNWSAANTGAQYIIIGTEKQTTVASSITGQILDVVVSNKDIMYIMTTGGVYRLREYNNAGTWTVESVTADITSKFRLGIQVGDRLWAGANNAVSSSPVKDWGTNLEAGTSITCGQRDGIITGLEDYIDQSGEQTLWVFKDNTAGYIRSGKFYKIDVREMAAAQDDSNGSAHIVQDTYLYFNMGPRLMRYYEPQIDDLGPNNLPTERLGKFTGFRGLPGAMLGIMNPCDYARKNNDSAYDLEVKFTTDKYASILAWTKGGWHEIYRAPNGCRITDVFPQSVHGDEPGRLWFILDGIILGYIEMPSYTTDLTEDVELSRFGPEWSVVMAPIDAGMKNLVKYCKSVKIYAEAKDEGVAVDNVWLDYLVETENSRYWQNIGVVQVHHEGKEFYTFDCGTYGISGKRLQFRIRGSAARMPVVYAIVPEIIARTENKWAYAIPFVIGDGQMTLDHQAISETPMDILAQLSAWGTGGPLLMRSTNPLFDNKTVLALPIVSMTTHINQIVRNGDGETTRRYIGTLQVQDV